MFLVALAAQIAVGVENARRSERERATIDRMAELWNEPIVALAEAVLAHAAGDLEQAGERLAASIARGREQGSHRLAARAESTALDLGLSLPD